LGKRSWHASKRAKALRGLRREVDKTSCGIHFIFMKCR